MKTRNSICGLLLIPLLLVCFGLSPTGTAATPETPFISPTPDGCYPGFNTAEGCQALLNINTAQGQGNTALGFAALKFLTTGDNNTAVGVNSLLFVTDAIQNTAVGQAALQKNNADGETAVGFQALASNTTGDENVATGFQALASNVAGESNTAVGYQALLSNDGDDNTAVGTEALWDSTTGIQNTAIGSYALYGNVDGNSNTAVGVGAGDLHVHGDGNVYIGQEVEGLATESNHTYIRNINTTSVSGMGTDTVTVNLSTGLLGHLSSSGRYKEDIKPMDKASEVLYQLNPVTYRYKKEIDETQSLDYGLVAEDVVKVDPNLANRNRDGQVESVRYNAIYNMMLNEFLKEHRKVEELKNDFQAMVARQQKEIQALTTQLKEQAAQIQKVSAQLEMSKPAPQTVLNNR
jgi:hypothetical protein